MSQPRDGRRSRTVLLSGLVVALVAVTATALYHKNPQKGTVTISASRSVTSDPTSAWPVYYFHAFNMTVPLLPGMVVCEDGDNFFSVRNTSCDSAIKPSFVVRRNAAWDAMTTVAAFDDAYGQQLKEGGLATIGTQGLLLGGKPVSIQVYNFSDSFAGAVATEALNVNISSKKVAIDINRDTPPHADGAQFTADELTKLFLEHVVLSPQPVSAKNTTTSEWLVLNDVTDGFSISYPSKSAPYEPASPAKLAVTFGNQVRLEVRTGNSVDATRGLLTGFRKLTEKLITVNKIPVNEERYVPDNPPGSAQRLLFVSFTKGKKTVGVTFTFSGDSAEETQFETLLGTFAFSGTQT